MSYQPEQSLQDEAIQMMQDQEREDAHEVQRMREEAQADEDYTDAKYDMI